MSAYMIKLIACISMLLDHIGYYSSNDGLPLRVLGRLAMPIYAFFIAEGYRRTKNRLNYALRLLLFAVISEVPFDLYFFGRTYFPGYQNVFFMLFLALIAIWVFDELSKRYESRIPAFLSLIAFCAVSELIHSDYGWEGILTCFIFFLYPVNEQQNMAPAAISMLGIYFLRLISSGGNDFYMLQVFRLAALLPLSAYNGKQTYITSPAIRKIIQYAFYVFYPAHLLILYAVF